MSKINTAILSGGNSDEEPIATLVQEFKGFLKQDVKPVSYSHTESMIQRSRRTHYRQDVEAAAAPAKKASPAKKAAPVKKAAVKRGYL